MTIQHQLDRFVDEAPDCSLVAFGDLSSGLILNWSSQTLCPREVLDLLGQKAVECFALLQVDELPPNTDQTEFGASVIHFTERGVQIFARHPANSDEVICAVCSWDAQLEPLLESVIDLAGKIEGMQ